MAATTAAILGSAAIGGGASILGARSQRRSARDAARAQMDATRMGILENRRSTDRAFDIYQSEASKARNFLTQQNALARKDLEPLRQMGLANLQRAQDFTDPNSPLAEQERQAFQKTLARNLSARGLTASGTEIAGLSDFELGLGRQRRDLSLNLAGVGAQTLQQSADLRNQLGTGLAGISQNLGSTGASLFSNLGQNNASLLMNQGQAQANSLLQQGQANAQGLIGLGNAFQTGILGLSQYKQNQAQQATATNQFNQLMSLLGGWSQ